MFILTTFLPLRIAFRYFCPNERSLLVVFLDLWMFQTESNRCYERFIDDFENFFENFFTEVAWSYDNSCGCIISNISFKVDGTVFNIDFIGVETYIGLSYEAFGFLLDFGSSSSPEKNISVMIGSLEDSIVWNNITVIEERSRFFRSTLANSPLVSIFQLLQRFRIYVHILESYVVRTFQQAYFAPI